MASHQLAIEVYAKGRVQALPFFAKSKYKHNSDSDTSESDEQRHKHSKKSKKKHKKNKKELQKKSPRDPQGRPKSALGEDLVDFWFILAPIWGPFRDPEAF